MKLNDFVLNSQYATLKNDTQSNTLSITINEGTLFDPNNPQLGSTTLNVGKINAGMRARGYSSKYNKWTIGPTLYSDTLVDIPSIPSYGTFTQSLYCNLDRINPTTVRLSVGTDGTNGAPTFRIKETQTITFVFSTFLSPFD